MILRLKPVFATYNKGKCCSVYSRELFIRFMWKQVSCATIDKSQRPVVPQEKLQTYVSHIRDTPRIVPQHDCGRDSFSRGAEACRISI